MGLLLLRYGEVGLKGHNRNYFLRKLRRNVRICLHDQGLAGTVWQDRQRIFLETEQPELAAEAVRRVFGLVSLSPVQVAPAELDAITDKAAEVARQAGLEPGRTFRVQARRADKSFPFISPEIERHVGAAIVAALGARVDLSGRADLELGIEVRPGSALIYGQVLAAAGGLPLGSQGRVVALVSSGIDSPVAAWLMMKRGCSVYPVHFCTSQAQAEQVQAIVEALNRYGYGSALKLTILSHDEAIGPVLARLRELHAERWTCLFCKRALLARAAQVAEELGAAALVTGDSLGQVASQTLSNLEVISYGLNKPILRPLIGMDKTEIMALARRIGTYEVSTAAAHTCPYLPARPLTQASVARLVELLDQLEGQPPGAPAVAGGVGARADAA